MRRKKKIPILVDYVFLTLPKKILKRDFSNKEFLENLRDEILLKIQGEPTEVSEEGDIKGLLLALKIAYRVSPEMVLREKDGKRILIFNHQPIPVLRDKAIITKFATKERVIGEGFKRHLEIDLKKIWQRNKKEKDYLERISNSLKEIKKKIKPAEVATIIGKVPTILILLTFYLLERITGEIWYSETKEKKGVKIYEPL